MAISSSTGATVSIDTSTATTTKTCVIPSDVPQGATIFIGVMNRTNEIATLDSISDPVNGSWNLTGAVSGPADSAGSTQRSWLAWRHNSAALSGAGNRTLTITTSAGISSQLVGGWVDLDGSTSALTTDEFDPTPHDYGSNTLDFDSDAVTCDAAGCIVGFAVTNNAQSTAWSEDSGGSTISAQAAGVRAGLFFKSTTAGAQSFTTTPAATTHGQFHIVAFLEPGAASPTGPRGYHNLQVQGMA